MPEPRFVIPGHGKAFAEVDEAIRFTREYIQYLRTQMGQAVQELTPFHEVYAETDWSQYADMPAFEASNRGNTYRVYLEMERESF